MSLQHCPLFTGRYSVLLQYCIIEILLRYNIIETDLLFYLYDLYCSTVVLRFSTDVLNDVMLYSCTVIVYTSINDQ